MILCFVIVSKYLVLIFGYYGRSAPFHFYGHYRIAADLS